MATSTARIEANRRNAARSTGPRTADGKATSRLNAFQHGMAGLGDVLGPGEDGRIVADRAAAFARELGAVGESGLLLARRAALLSVRMERLAADEMVAVRAAEREARADFDAGRVADIAELIAEAEAPGADPGEALAALAGCPDGLGRLLGAWRELLAGLRSAEAGAAVEVATRWLGGDDARGDGPGDLIGRAEAEVERLRGVAGTMGGVERALERARVEAVLAARLDPGPEVVLARRYEAAAERGMFRAFRAIAAINRQRDRAGLGASLPRAVVEGAAPSPLLGRGDRGPIGPLDPLDPLASFRGGVGDPLASFRVGIAPGGGMADPGRSGPPGDDPTTPEARRRRPDGRKLAANRR